MKAPTTLGPDIAFNDSQFDSGVASDEALMSSLEMGDCRALEILIGRYRGLLKNVILRIVHDHAAADDVLQSCLLEVWKSAHHYSAAKDKPLGWMITLARRRAIDSLHRRLAYHRAIDRLKKEHGDQSFAQSADDGDADLSSILRLYIDQLPPTQQQVIQLAFIKGVN